MSDLDVVDEAFVTGWIARYLAGWNTRDPEAILACVTGDVEWHDPSIPGGGAACGHAPVREWLRGFFRTFPDVEFAHLEGHQVTEGLYLSMDQRRVAAPWRCTGTMLGPIEPPGVPATGRKVNLTGVDLYAFRGGLACTVRTITDLQEAGRQLGLVPPPGSLPERLGILVLKARGLLRRRT